MKTSLKNLLTIAVLVALLLVSSAPVFAQDLPAPFCGKLDDEDCEILTKSQLAMTEVSAAVNGSELNIEIAGIPGLPVDELSFQMTQDVSYALDPELAAELIDLQLTPPEKIAKNIEKVLELVVELYSTMAMDDTIYLSIPKEVAALLSQQANFPLPDEISVQFRIVDGYAYLNLDEVAPYVPELQGMKGWVGIDIATLIKSALEEGMAQQAAEMETEQMAASMTGFGINSFLASEEGRALFEEFVEVDRAKDAKIDGQQVAVFESTFDFGGFIASPIFHDLIISQLDMINQMADTSLTKAEVDEAMTLMPLVGPMLFSGLDFKVTQSIGAEDFYVYENSLIFDWDLQSIIAAARMMDADQLGLDLPSEDVAPVIKIDFVSSSSAFNEDPEITAPEDAMIIPLEALQGAQ